METRLTLRPGQNGTRKLAERFGKRLVQVRYRYDETLRKRYTTVELIVAESDWTPRSRRPHGTRPPDQMVYVRIAYGEEGLRARVDPLGPLCHSARIVIRVSGRSAHRSCTPRSAHRRTARGIQFPSKAACALTPAVQSN